MRAVFYMRHRCRGNMPLKWHIGGAASRRSNLPTRSSVKSLSGFFLKVLLCVAEKASDN